MNGPTDTQACMPNLSGIQPLAETADPI